MVTKRELSEAQGLLNTNVDTVLRRLDEVGPAIVVGDRLLRLSLASLRVARDDLKSKRDQLDGQGPAVARSTSIAAAKANIMLKQSLRRTILSLIVNHYTGFGVGLTSDYIQGRLKGKHQSVSARISELVNTYGLLVDSGQRAETSTGSKAIMWAPTQEAIDLVLAAQGDGAGV